MKKMCKLCVNDTTVKNIHFNEAGICNFCVSYQEIKPVLSDYVKLEANFLNRINRNRGQHKYDVAMGLSGGKDSTYVLYQLVHQYHLKVIAYTLDNGFLSIEAKNKIDTIVKELNVPHEYVTCDKTLLKTMYHYIVKRYLSPCIACSYLGYAMMINYTTKIDAGVGMHGRSPYQMFRNFDKKIDDPFYHFVTAGLCDVADVDFTHLYQQAMNQITKYIDPLLASEINHQLLKDAKAQGYRDFIAYFLYHPYDKTQIIDELTKALTWKVETEDEHFDCQIHHATMYLKNIIARRSHLMLEISVMIRSGKITQAEGIQLLKIVKPTVPNAELDLFCKYAKLNKRWLLTKAKIYGMRWW